jgi:hypothetical protein
MAINPIPTINQIQSDASIAPITSVRVAVAGLQPRGGDGTSAAQSAENRINTNRSVFTLEATEAMPRYWFMITVMDFQGYSGFGGSPGSVQVAENALGSIRLPIPRGLDDVQDVQYSETPMGPALGGMYNAYQSGAGATGMATAGTMGLGLQNPGTAGAAMGAAIGSPFGLSIPAAAAGAVAGGAAVDAIGGAVGIAVNQFYTILLQGPKYKSYTLSFDLAPRTAGESQNIREIIRILRRTAAPELVGPYGMFWDFPDIVECAFMPQGNGRDTYMYRFKPAVLSSVQARYNPNSGVVGFYGSTDAPEAITLSLSFTELEYWLRRDFQ